MNNINKLSVFGLSGRVIVEYLSSKIESLNFENKEIINSAKKYYKSVLLVDPNKTSIELNRGSDARIYFNENEITNLETLLVRGTGGIESSSKVLVNALFELGCYIVDPITRFSGEKASKLITTISRHKLGVGSTSFLILGDCQVERVVDRIDSQKMFPILIKPIYGKHGIGIEKINSKNEALNFMIDYFQNENQSALLVQKWINFKTEYRCLIVNGYSIGLTKKERRRNSLTANANNCDNFTKVNNKNIEKFVIQNSSNEGLLGIDVAVSEEDEIHIIEANREPEWYTFQNAVGFNVADVIIKNIFKATIRNKNQTI